MATGKSDKKTGNSGNSTKKVVKKGPANTPAAPYLDTFNKHPDCQQDKQNIEDKCKDTEQNKKNAHDAAKQGKPTSKNAKLGNVMGQIKDGVQALDNGAKTLYGYKRDAQNSWVEDHCDHLWVKPAGANIDKFNEQLQNIRQKLDQNIDAVVRQAGGVIVDKAKDTAVNYGEKAVAREVASLASLTIPVVGEVIVGGMTIYNIADGVWTGGKMVYEASSSAKKAYDNIQGIRDQIDKIQGLLDKKYSPTELWADTMSGMAYVNPCLQARRCQLVPFGETSAKKQANSGQGCCPGQTGHHLLPEEMFQDCPEYTKEKHKNAPTVCVEGVNNSHGTHGIIHSKLEKKMSDYRLSNPVSDKISKDDAVKAATLSHMETFKPACNQKCLKAQLDEYYDDLCKDKIKPRGGKGVDIEESTQTSGGIGTR